MRRYLLTSIVWACLAGSLLVLPSGCELLGLGPIATDSIDVDFRVTRENGVDTATASFRLSLTGSYLQLAGDTIECNGVELTLDKAQTPLVYSAVVPSSASYAFTFTRPNETPYVSTVSVPGAISISSPVADTTISRAANFEVRWSPSGSGLADISLVIPCVEVDELLADQANDGSHIVTSDSFVVDPSNASETCDDGEVGVSITEEGDLDAALQGVILGQSVDTVQFRSEP